MARVNQNPPRIVVVIENGVVAGAFADELDVELIVVSADDLHYQLTEDSDVVELPVPDDHPIVGVRFRETPIFLPHICHEAATADGLDISDWLEQQAMEDLEDIEQQYRQELRDEMGEGVPEGVNERDWVEAVHRDRDEEAELFTDPGSDHVQPN